jgi:hypothetical protein
MILKLNNEEVEVELGRNSDGSRYINKGYYTALGLDLTSSELDQLEDEYGADINSNWRGE